jgi:peroxidase
MSHPETEAKESPVITDPITGLTAVTSYSVTGAGNIPNNPTLGAAGTAEVRLGPANFAPGTTDTPVDGPNPRVISNALFSGPQQADSVPPAPRSANFYVFGQFVDHDLDLNPVDLNPEPNTGNTLATVVPSDDTGLPPGSTIAITRGVTDPATGNPINAVTHFLDLSQVYGSDRATAASLRNPDGTLKTSAGNNPPIDGSQFMMGTGDQFVSGDARVGENPELTAMTTLFIREHNYWVERLHAENPALTGDQLFAEARAITTAEYQNIVYSEFVPQIIGQGTLSPYKGFSSNVSPQVSVEFSTGAYRFAHTTVSDTQTKIDNFANVLQVVSLTETFTQTPEQVEAAGGLDALIRNAASDFAQQEGLSVAPSLRNQLVDTPPGDFGDLIAIDILRERDLGVPTLNQTRTALGLSPYTSFDQITSDPTIQSDLASIYGTPDKLDLFVGGLAETKVPGADVGPAFQAVIAHQFEVLRDGDPLFYLNQGFSPAVMQTIQNTTLSDLIYRDGDANGTPMVVQQDAFVQATRHASTVSNPNPGTPGLVIGVDDPGAVIAGDPDVDDTIVAGAALHQILRGGGMHDAFVFLGGGHIDKIEAFSPGDTIDFENALANSSVEITGGNGVTQIATNGNKITVEGMNPSDFNASNVLFNTYQPQLEATQRVSFQISGVPDGTFTTEPQFLALHA